MIDGWAVLPNRVSFEWTSKIQYMRMDVKHLYKLSLKIHFGSVTLSGTFFQSKDHLNAGTYCISLILEYLKLVI
jgi:hypothetical protein